MARPRKKGLPYFPEDTDFYEDFKIMDLLDKYGPLGVVVYDVIRKMVYKESYYLEISVEHLAPKVIRTIGNRWTKNKEFVIQVIHYCADIGLFDSVLLNRSVITSVGIQRRYANVTVRNKANKEKYWLIDENGEPLKNAPNTQVLETETPQNVAETLENVTKMTINKTKENKTKLKKTKQNKDEKDLSCCVFDTFKDCIHEPTEAEQGALTALCDEHGEYVVKQAIKAAKGKGRSVNYVKGIINNWKKTGDTQAASNTPDKSYDLEEFEKLSLNNPPDKETEDNDAN